MSPLSELSFTAESLTNLSGEAMSVIAKVFLTDS
jgi:hypothetical protein